MILAGDIGATKVNLGLFEVVGEELLLKRVEGYRNQDFPDIESVLRTFLAGEATPQKTCLGVAGPVVEETVRLTNYPWRVSAGQLGKVFGIKEVRLVNDLAALAAAIPYLPDSDLDILQPGAPGVSGRCVVLAPGTGLGQAFLFPKQDGCFEVVDTEGGQCDFAPTDSEEVELWHYLKQQQSRVPVESILSGPGLSALYGFYRSLQEADKREGDEETVSPDRVSSRGLEDEDGPFRMALDRFASVLGTVASNLVLQVMGRGGVFIGGGIPPKIIDRLKNGPFLERFLDKPPFRDILERVPVRVIMNEHAALRGAAAWVMDHSRIC